MSKLEQFILILFGFLTFEIVFIRLGFFLGKPITSYTLLLSFIMYVAGVMAVYSSRYFSIEEKIKRYVPLCFFIIVSFFLAVGAWVLSYTYDTSWDGQGYHQSAVIAMASNWNPIHESAIHFKQHLPSQIFAEGYPSALWELESTVYKLTGRINSAKIWNFVIAIIAGLTLYSFLRKLKLEKFTSFIVSLIIVLQPVYIIQLLTFMEDGFGYEVLLIAAASLATIIVSSKSYWAISCFLMAELFLVTTKYSHLPVALILGMLFVPVVFNRFLNNEYFLTKFTKVFLIGVSLVTLIFAYLPYGRNQLFHGALFYPTNIPALMGSVKYNNVPNNLQDSNKVSLLFYGIFSKAQSKESGDPRNVHNVAQLRSPFLFSLTELKDSAELYNNRVGGGGPLYSGVVLLSFLLVMFLYFKTQNRKERYTIYSAIFSFVLILLLSLLAPTPNLLRYVNQLQLLPFAVIIPVLTIFKRPYIQVFCWILIMLAGLNVLLFSTVVFTKNISEAKALDSQFTQMRNSGKTYQVKAQQFYSSYLILSEQNIPYIAVDHLKCKDISVMVTSSTTTQYCEYKRE